MARPRTPWKHSVGRYGSTVKIYEPRVGGALRWDYREEGKRTRPEVDPPTYVRRSPTEPPDPTLVQQAKDLCEQKAAELTLLPLRQAAAPEALTVGRAYEYFFDPRRKALPPSRVARTHHEGARKFWEHELGAETPWDTIVPNDVWSALLRLKELGKIPTAEKRLRLLRTLYRWLRDMMGYDLLRDPTRGLDLKKLKEGYRPRRPRLSALERKALRRVVRTLRWRTRLFFTLLVGSGTRAVQARSAMRSGLDGPLDVPPPKGTLPFGWMVLAGVKGQKPHVTPLTWRQRLEIARVIWKVWDGEQWVPGPLAAWEQLYQAGELKDYPLIPAGREDRDELEMKPISDRSLRKELESIFTAAKIKIVDRLGFHAVRRSWADHIHESEGLDVATSAGGWSRGETVEEAYLSEVRHGHLERARQRMEEEESDE